MSDISRDFKGIWIPREIWLDRSLSYFEICLFSEIHSLCGKNGCYASNEYFMDFFKERERKIQEGIGKLKQKGYLILESFDGRTRVLRTKFPQNEDVKSEFSTSEVRNPEKQESVKSLFSTPNMLKKDLSQPDQSIYTEIKDYRKEQQPAPPAVVVFPSSLDKLNLTDSLKKKLLKSYSIPEIDIAVERCLAWKGRESDAAAIQETLKNAQGWQDKTSPEQRHQSNKEIALEFESKIKPIKGIRFEVCNKYIEISGAARDSIIIEYTANGFRDQLESALRKYRLI